MILSHEETMAIIPSLYSDALGLTSSDAAGELRPKGLIRLEVLRSILRRSLIETKWVLSDDEKRLAGL